jgi:hypothetical protein
MPQMYIYSFISHTQQQANFKLSLVTIFGSNIQTSSGRYTRTGKQKTLQVMYEISPWT